MIRVAIVVGSTRPGRRAEVVARWVYDIASKRGDAEFEIVDILDFNLPLLDEPMSPARGEYTQPHTKAWSAKIDSFDAFVFVTPEYNHGPSGALKNAIDFLYREWNNKAAAFVSYGGGASGTRAVEQLRLVMGELQVADVRAQVALSLATDFQNYVTFKPAARHDALVGTMLDQLISWAVALQGVRSGERACPVHDTTRDEPFKRGAMEQWHDRAIR
jgi:NAD(P)H-dependent FMN reductase